MNWEKFTQTPEVREIITSIIALGLAGLAGWLAIDTANVCAKLVGG